MKSQETLRNGEAGKTMSQYEVSNGEHISLAGTESLPHLHTNAVPGSSGRTLISRPHTGYGWGKVVVDKVNLDGYLSIGV